MPGGSWVRLHDKRLPASNHLIPSTINLESSTRTKMIGTTLTFSVSTSDIANSSSGLGQLILRLHSPP